MVDTLHQLLLLGALMQRDNPVAITQPRLGSGRRGLKGSPQPSNPIFGRMALVVSRRIGWSGGDPEDVVETGCAPFLIPTTANTPMTNFTSVNCRLIMVHACFGNCQAMARCGRLAPG